VNIGYLLIERTFSSTSGGSMTDLGLHVARSVEHRRRRGITRLGGWERRRHDRAISGPRRRPAW
jgi:hypothetical protein